MATMLTRSQVTKWRDDTTGKDLSPREVWELCDALLDAWSDYHARPAPEPEDAARREETEAYMDAVRAQRMVDRGGESGGAASSAGGQTATPDHPPATNVMAAFEAIIQAERETFLADTLADIDHADDVALRHAEGHDLYAIESYLSALAHFAAEEYATRWQIILPSPSPPEGT